MESVDDLIEVTPADELLKIQQDALVLADRVQSNSNRPSAEVIALGLRAIAARTAAVMVMLAALPTADPGEHYGA